MLPFSELPPSLDGGLDDSELECSSSSVCVEDELFPSFCLPLDFLEGVLALGFFFFVLKQLRKHLLEAVDRFLLSTNHIELLPLGLGLLFKALGHFFRSACHICEGFFLYGRVLGL